MKNKGYSFMKLKIFIPLMLLLTLLSSCGDRYKKITPDPVNNKITQDARPKFDFEGFSRGEVEDPCFSPDYNWESLGYSCRSGFLKGTAGRLFFQKWSLQDKNIPEKERGTIIIVTGRTEFTDKYHHVIEIISRLNSELKGKMNFGHAYDIVVYDHQGQGRSEGLAAHGSLEDYVEDLTRVTQTFGNKNNQNAVIAHSMGALVATKYMQTQGIKRKELGRENFKEINAFVLSAPMFVINTGKKKYEEAYVLVRSKIKAGAELERFPMKGSGRGLSQKNYTDNSSEWGHLEHNPLTMIGDPTYKWLETAVIKAPKVAFKFPSWMDMYFGDEDSSLNKKAFLLIDSENDSVVKNRSFDRSFFEEIFRTDGKSPIPAKYQDLLDPEMKERSATSFLCEMLNGIAKKEGISGNPCWRHTDKDLDAAATLQSLKVTEHTEDLGYHDTFLNTDSELMVAKALVYMANIIPAMKRNEAADIRKEEEKKRKN